MTSTTPISISRPAVPTNAQSPSLAEERREVFESVLSALALDPLDADKLAAGGRLLRHLSRTAGPRPWLA
jgi:hypothetical protein